MIHRWVNKTLTGYRPHFGVTRKMMNELVYMRYRAARCISILIGTLGLQRATLANLGARRQPLNQCRPSRPPSICPYSDHPSRPYSLTQFALIPPVSGLTALPSLATSRRRDCVLCRVSLPKYESKKVISLHSFHGGSSTSFGHAIPLFDPAHSSSRFMQPSAASAHPTPLEFHFFLGISNSSSLSFSRMFTSERRCIHLRTCSTPCLLPIMAGLRLLSVLLAAQCVSGAPYWLAKRWTLPPAAALNGVLPAWLDLPDGEDVIRQFGLDLDQYSVQVGFNSHYPSILAKTIISLGYANWTSNGWHVRLHGQTYRIPALAGSDIDDLAKPFVPGVDYDSMNETTKAQARNMTSSMYAIPQSGVGVEVDFVYNRQSIARARLPQRTDERGEFDAFVNVNVSTGTVPNGDQTEFTQGIQKVGNASSYFVPTHGFTLITDIDDILRETRIYEPDAGMRNSYIYPFKPWRNMPDVFRLWQSVSPSLHFHYLSTIPIKLSRPYMNFIYGTYPIGSFDVRPMNYTTLSHVSESRRLNLEQILQSFPQRKFILLGETSNADIMTQYPIMAKKYIDRVQCVLLRNTSATDSGDFLPNLKPTREVQDDIAGLNFTNGECRNSSVPQNVTFDFEGVPRLLNAASPRVGSMPFAYGLALLLGASLGLVL
ncbi:hypothetical protein AG1IA_06439 [Rhizoctonia solani AG-1 IA]|uniref:Phosphatidate phosphatase APP1 catalytic domain-containing protein n=1 Tax=Thanatephorus cucumeris (strain AG1-IA) TaxID=983506 RepID=L8WS16_THACA|nr:hypothetical protein AG1IA_06439 [Rhizoctonia solani AG-1 IA]